MAAFMLIPSCDCQMRWLLHSLSYQEIIIRLAVNLSVNFHARHFGVLPDLASGWTSLHALFLSVQLSPTVDQWRTVQSISFAFSLYDSSSYGAKLKMITAHHWSPVCFLFMPSVYQYDQSYCRWMQDMHWTCIAQTGSPHILPLFIFPVRCNRLDPVCVSTCVVFFLMFFFNFHLLKSPLNASYSFWHALNGSR